MTFRACLFVLGLAIFAVIFMVYNGQFGKLWGITWANTPVWFIIALVAGWGLFWTLYKKEMNWVEYLVYLLFCIPMTIPFIMMGYWWSTGLYAVENINGYVHGGEYYEAYTTETTYTDSDGKEHTTRTYHPPEWYLLSSVVLHGHRQKVDCTSRDYKHYVKKFGNEKFHLLSHVGQVSVGDGNMYSTAWDGKASTKTPMVSPHPYVSYIKASERMKSMHALVSGYEELLREYPEIHGGPNGPIELDRVLVAGASVPSGWVREVDRLLDEKLMQLGSAKQCNILVYVVHTGNRGFAGALEGYWTGGNKNDVIVIVGTTHYPKIDFADVLCLNTQPLFPIALRDELESLGTLDVSAKQFAEIVTSHVAKPASQGGYEREPMAAYEYLKYEIRLPLWASILLVVFSVGCTTPFMIFFLTNDFDDEDTNILLKGT